MPIASLVMKMLFIFNYVGEERRVKEEVGKKVDISEY
jgi:hypothetical protein